MSIKRSGFTLVEIALFLAITGLLFVGIIAGTNNSIAQQRFNDSSQNFIELLRSIYSEVSNPQSAGEGRADVAIYGKLITFGQNYGLDGNKIADSLEQRIFIYDVVGNAENAGSGSVANVLADLRANVAVVTERDDVGNVIRMGPAGEVKSYVLRWGASLEKIDKKDESDPRGNLFTGSILIVRHPKSGTINTLYSSKTIQVNQVLQKANSSLERDFKDADALLSSKLSSFSTRELDFCINPGGAEKESEVRRDIRLTKNARNASGVEMVDLDLDEVVDGEQIGNRCRFSN